MTLRYWAPLIILGNLIASGCAHPYYVEYETKTMRMRPVVKPGDTIDFGVKIAWVYESPCEDDSATNAMGGSRCKIAKGLAFRRFAYVCTEKDCDPEVAVDDNPGQPLIGTHRTLNVAAGLDRSPSHVVYLRCGTGTKVDVKPPDLTGATGTIVWDNLQGDLKDDWKVTFADSTVCSEGATIDHDGVCTIKGTSGTKYAYTVTSPNCTNAGAASVTPK